MIAEAVKLSWDMVSLVPPPVVDQPATEYNEDWHEKRLTSWDDDSPSKPLVYFRPVLYYSCLGHVGCKGVVGNALPNAKVIDCQYSSGPFADHTEHNAIENAK